MAVRPARGLTSLATPPVDMIHWSHPEPPEDHVAVDPQIAAILAMLETSGAPALSSGTPEQARAQFRFTTVDLRDPATLPQVASVDNAAVDGPSGPIPVRIYRPDCAAPVPTIVFFHGGGFVIGDLDTHDDHGRLLCRDVEAVVISVDYRLAPEHKFPAGFEDCFAATTWAADAIGELGGDPQRLAGGRGHGRGDLPAAGGAPPP